MRPSAQGNTIAFKDLLSSPKYYFYSFSVAPQLLGVIVSAFSSAFRLLFSRFAFHTGVIPFLSSSTLNVFFFSRPLFSVLRVLPFIPRSPLITARTCVYDVGYVRGRLFTSFDFSTVLRTFHSCHSLSPRTIPVRKRSFLYFFLYFSSLFFRELRCL